MELDGYRASRAVLTAFGTLGVLGLSVIAASAARPPVVGDGAWTTPLEILLGLIGLVLLVTLVVVVRNLTGGRTPRSRPSSRSRWSVLLASLLVALAVWWATGGGPADPPPVTDGSFGSLLGGGGAGGGPVQVSTAAILGGLLSLVLGALLVAVLLGRPPQRRAAAPPQGALDGGALDGAVEGLPAGPPDAVVLAAWAIARGEVVAAIGAGEHDPPVHLLRRMRGTDVEGPLRTLTFSYLPIRYGRATATEADAASSRAALDAVRRWCVGARS